MYILPSVSSASSAVIREDLMIEVYQMAHRKSSILLIKSIC
jgi:hypothetical protein